MAKKKVNKKKKTKKVGRPTKYKSEYCKKLIDYFDVEPYTDIEIEHYKKGEISWIDKKRMANRMPTLRQFAKKIKVSHDTIYSWLNEKSNTYQQEFSDAYKRALEYRKEFLIECGLQGLHNPLYAKFIAVNLTDMRDRQEQAIDASQGLQDFIKWLKNGENGNGQQNDK